MKNFHQHFFIFFCLLCEGILGSHSMLLATSIDARSNVAYQQNNHVFANAESAKGFVYFANGFTVAPDASITMDSVGSVSGAINLQGTGHVHLAHDLVLDTHAVFSDGGYFSAYGNGIMLGGNITIPAGKAIHCIGDIFIDGGGRTLHLEPHAQFLVEPNSVLTLRNMVISPERMGALTPAVQCDATGTLCLDNVVINLSNDLQFDKGNVYVQHDVVVSGTSALRYASPEVFNIEPHSTLYMDHHTTFSFLPKRNKVDRLNMHDVSSKMVFDSAKFISMGYDLRFSRGTIIFDGVSHFEHYGAEMVEAVDGLTHLFTENIPNIRMASWSPDGGHVLVGYGVESKTSLHYVQLYSFDGKVLTPKGDPINYGGGGPSFTYFVTSISWSHDGAYVAVGTSRFNDVSFNSTKLYNYDLGSLYVYALEQSGLSAKCSIALPNETGAHKIAWSPTGDFIGVSAVKLRVNPNWYWDFRKFFVYQLSRTSTPHTLTLKTQLNADMANSISWAPNNSSDLYVAVGVPIVGTDGWPSFFYGDTAQAYIRVYKDAGKNGELSSTPVATKACSGCKQVAWSPDGNWIAAARGGEGLTIYQWTGDGFGQIEVVATGLSAMTSVSWLPDSKYLAVGCADNTVKIYVFNGVDLMDTNVKAGMNGIKHVAWLPEDGSHLLGCYANNVDIFKTEFGQDFVPASGKLVYLGPLSDLNVTMMPGTRVNLHGEMTKRSRPISLDDLAKILTKNISNIRMASWSPDGRHVLVGYGVEAPNTSHSIQLYSFNGDTLVSQGAPVSFSALRVTSISWSHDGAYVAVGTSRFYNTDTVIYNYDNGSLYVYALGGEGLDARATVTLPDSIGSYKIAWSPYDYFIGVSAVKADAAPNWNWRMRKFFVYQFTTSNNSLALKTQLDTGIANSISWAPDNFSALYVAVGYPGFGSDGWPRAFTYDGSLYEIRVYKDSGKNGVMVQHRTKACSECKQVAWSPDGNWIAAARGGKGLTIYQWTGDDFGETEITASGITGMTSVSWFADSKYLAVGYVTDKIRIFAFDGVTLSDTGVMIRNLEGFKKVEMVPNNSSYLLGCYTDNFDIFKPVFI